MKVNFDYFKGQFYARSGVCVSLHLTNEPRPGWEYSVAIFVGLNFLCFLIITIGYLYMYCVVRQSSQAVGSVGSKTDTRDKELALARKMTLIVMTDFFCWAPVIMMSKFIMPHICTKMYKQHQWNLTYYVSIFA